MIDWNSRKISKISESIQWDNEWDEWYLQSIISTKEKGIFLLVYNLNNWITVIVRNFEDNWEIQSFSSQLDEVNTDYLVGHNSKYGYMWFKNYIVNLDECFPNIFLKVKNSTNENNWNEGMRISSTEDCILSNEDIILSSSFQDFETVGVNAENFSNAEANILGRFINNKRIYQFVN